MQTFQIVYHSFNQLQTQGPELVDDLKVLLRQAIRNNSRLGVTGGLVFNTKHFLQVLEGSESSVRELMQRIAHDRRHAQIKILQARQVSKRLFTRWAMGFAGKSTTIDRVRAQLGDDLAKAHTMRVNEIVSLVYELVSQEEHTAGSARVPDLEQLAQ